MKRTALPASLFFILSSWALAQAPDQAVRSLLQVNEAAQAAAGAEPARAAQLGARAYDAAGKGAAAVVVPAAQRGARSVTLSLPAAPAPALVKPALPVAPAAGRFSGPFLGLYPESGFDLTTGRACGSCRAPQEGTWYFLDDVIAVPKVGRPSLIWIGSNEMVEGATILPDGNTVRLKDGTVLPLGRVPKIESNRSYYDESTTRFFQGRTVRIRGEFVMENGVKKLIARTIWPEDFRVDWKNLTVQPALNDEDIRALVQEEQGGVRSPFRSRLLWERPGSERDWAGKAVIGVMLNGAQGDDDDAHVGHFSAMTGRFGPNGEMADWMFSNFYDLGSVSEKGILPSLIPMDKYLADLNSGQNYYRGTHVLAAVLKDDRAAARLQDAFEERYAEYYAHKYVFHRTTNPCSGLVMDEVREQGWNVPTRGSTWLPVALLARLGLTLGSGPQAGAEIYNFMRQETTRLFPRTAFEAVGTDLLNLAGAGGVRVRRRTTELERQLQEDIEAIVFIRMPQIPSSREFGQDPAGSALEYFGRVPLDRSKWKKGPENPPRSWPPPGAPGAPNS